MLEKVPFLILTAGASAVTFFVQQAAGAVSSLQVLPLPVRLANAVVSYGRYIVKTFWPADLAVIYTYNPNLPLVILIATGLLLGLVTALCVWCWRRAPYLLVGWLWFLGTLVPTIGIVQVGTQSMADRYMYIPSIGLFVMVVWGLSSLLRARFDSVVFTRAVGASTSLLLAALLGCTWLQLRHWKDGEVLFKHAIKVTGGSYYAYYGLAGALHLAGKKDEGLAAYEESVRLNSFFADAQINIGKALLERGKVDEATVHLQKAVSLAPRDPETHYNLGTIYLVRSNFVDAASEFSSALKLNPRYAKAHSNLGVALMKQQKLMEGADHLYKAVQLEPDNPEAHANLALALLELGYPGKASECLLESLRLKPAVPGNVYYLALAFSRANKSEEAVRTAQKARELAVTASQTEVVAKAEELIQSCQSAKGLGQAL